MAVQDIAARYRRSFLGPFWITLTQVAFAVGIGLLHGQIFGQPIRESVSFLICGLSAWYLLQSFFLEGSNLVIGSAGIISNVRAPLSMLAARIICRDLIIYGHNLIAALAVLLALKGGLPLTVFWLAPALVLTAVFGLGVALTLGPICARYRDLPQTVAVVMQLAFFLSPVFWPPELISGRSHLMEFNPLHHFLQLLREPLLGRAPDLHNWRVSAACALGAIVLGALTVALTRKRVFYWL